MKMPTKKNISIKVSNKKLTYEVVLRFIFVSLTLNTTYQETDFSFNFHPLAMSWLCRFGCCFCFFFVNFHFIVVLRYEAVMKSLIGNVGGEVNASSLYFYKQQHNINFDILNSEITNPYLSSIIQTENFPLMLKTSKTGLGQLKIVFGVEKIRLKYNALTHSSSDSHKTFQEEKNVVPIFLHFSGMLQEMLRRPQLAKNLEMKTARSSNEIVISEDSLFLL